MEEELGGSFVTHVGGERCLEGFGWSFLRKETTGNTCRTWENNIRKIFINETNWIRMSADRVEWRAFVSKVMILRCP
jgi:hypothetical protein